MSGFVVVDIGGTNIRAAYFTSNNPKPELISTTRIRSPQKSLDEKAENIYNLLIDLVDRVTQDIDSDLTICIAVPGPMDRNNGVLVDAPNIPGWNNSNIKEILESQFNHPVIIGNDANFSALGEWRFGAGKTHSHIIYITVGTGIGGGLILDGKLFTGHNGLAAEIGHITVLPDGPLCNCGKRGHLSALASGTAISRWYFDQTNAHSNNENRPKSPIDSEKISQLALQGDPIAEEAFSHAGGYIGLVLTDLIHVINPSAVIVGGGVSKCGSLIMDPIKDSINKYIRSPRYLDGLVITTSMLGDEAGLIGGYFHALSSNTNKL